MRSRTGNDEVKTALNSECTALPYDDQSFITMPISCWTLLPYSKFCPRHVSQLLCQ